MYQFELIFHLFLECLFCRGCVLLSLDFSIISFSPLSRGCFWKESNFTFYSSRSSRQNIFASGGTTLAHTVSMKNHPSLIVWSQLDTQINDSIRQWNHSLTQSYIDTPMD